MERCVSKATASLAIIVFLMACQRGSPAIGLIPVILSNPKNVFVTDFGPSGAWATAEGRWKRTEGSLDFPSMPEVNSVYIRCKKPEMVCYEATAGLKSVSGGYSSMTVSLFTYRVSSWTESQIRAVTENGPSRDELVLRLKSEQVERIFERYEKPKIFQRWLLGGPR